MLRKLFAVSVPFVVAALAACGGQVVFVEDGGEGGQGGNATTTATKGTAVTTKATNNSVTTHSATIGSTGVVGTSSGGPICDTGEPGDGGSDVCFVCQECSFQASCFDEVEACNANPDCWAFNDCLANCGGPDCQQDCEATFPLGSQLLYDLAFCVLCEECPINCGTEGCEEFP
jgi:hypothetical protein